MSGPKDFVVVFAVERLLEMQYRRAAAERNRAASLRVKQEAARERAAQQAARAAEKARAAKLRADQELARAREEQQLARAEANRTQTSEQLRVAAEGRVQDMAARNAARRLRETLAERESRRASEEAAQGGASSKQQAQADQPVAGSTAAEPSAAVVGSRESPPPAQPDDVNFEQVTRQWLELQAELETWQQELADDAAIKQFQSAPAAAWQVNCQNLSARLSSPPTSGELADIERQTKVLCEDAVRIHQEAGERQSKFETRNELLADIMSSLQEIGFFVSDPEYQDPHDPGGAVIIKATRGGEEICAAVDLTETVRSVWNGVTDENCKEGFFDYLDRMKQKGVEIHAIREDLQARPVLKQAGAKELPRSGVQRQGS